MTAIPSSLINTANNNNTSPFTDRIISSSIGALLTSLAVTPLEVVKVRLQTQGHVPLLTNNKSILASNNTNELLLATNPNTCPRCLDYIYDDGLMERRFSKYELAYRCKEHVKFTSPTHAFLWIVRNEGVGSLYNGLHATLWMSIPATVLYFSAYDELKSRTFLGPSISGATARIFAVTCVAPFELLRTRQQSETNPQGMIGLYQRELAAAADRNNRGQTLTTTTTGSRKFLPQFPWFLWRGLSPTLWRDVPFSAIYWHIVERVKTSPYIWKTFGFVNDSTNPFIVSSSNPILKQQQQPLPISISFIAACIGGGVAAFFTHPFDVVKTRRQVFEFAQDHVPTKEETSTVRIIQRIIQKDGWKGLFIGIGPRIGKIIPSTAIMLTTYDWGKNWLANYRVGNNNNNPSTTSPNPVGRNSSLR
jgi:solute carrier family 25 protein 39/40